MIAEADQATTGSTLGEPAGPPGERPSTERLLSALQAYDAASSDAQQVYGHLIRKDGEPMLLALLDLAVEEHRRHQRTIERLTRIVRALADREPALASTADAWFQAETAPEAIRFLIREERANAQHLRHLARQEPRLGEGLFATMLEGMARDDDKHEHLLRFLLRHQELDRKTHAA